MSRLWDTPEFWARSEADEALREMPDRDPAALADSFERTMSTYDGDTDMAAAIIAELRRRATAGVRFWTGPQSTPDGSPGAIDQSPVRAEPSIADLIDDEIPW